MCLQYNLSLQPLLKSTLSSCHCIFTFSVECIASSGKVANMAIGNLSLVNLFWAMWHQWVIAAANHRMELTGVVNTQDNVIVWAKLQVHSANVMDEMFEILSIHDLLEMESHLQGVILVDDA